MSNFYYMSLQLVKQQLVEEPDVTEAIANWLAYTAVFAILIYSIPLVFSLVAFEYPNVLLSSKKALNRMNDLEYIQRLTNRPHLFSVGQL